MIGRKLFFGKKQPKIVEETILVQTPDLREISYVFIKKSREYGYIIRFSVRSSKLLKRQYKGLTKKIRRITKKHTSHREEMEKKEVSGFLKKISEYKYKVRKIKDKIIEEEKENL